MKSEHLPSVLHANNSADSISMERSLKQIRNLLMNLSTSDIAEEDRLMASLDDVETMLKAIKHD